MVATVNASTSAGVVITPDNSGVLAFQSSSATALTIDASQNSTFVGTASATKLIPTGSSATGNGMYLPAANSLGLSTNGTNAVYIDSSQNVGIGTTAPQQRLGIKAASNVPQLYLIQDNVANDGYKLFSDSSAGYLSFLRTSSGSDTERMRIDSSGSVRINNTSNATFAAQLNIYSPSTLNCAIHCRTNTSGGQSQIIFGNATNDSVGGITTTGSATAYATSSDYRLKENIVPMTGALAIVSQLKPVKYKWKTNGSDGQGFIAHELQAVVPDCVTGTKDAVDANGNPVHQGVDTSFLVATLTAAIQELKAINDTLTARIVALETA
jgi:lipopolysaccharide export system protein LptA